MTAHTRENEVGKSTGSGLIGRLMKTVVVPFGGTGSEEHLLKCVDSLRSNANLFDELFVVLDGMEPNRVDALKLRLSIGGTKVIQLATCVGPAAARNAAVHASGLAGGLLVFVDADVEVGPEFTSQIDAVFEAHPEIDACFGSYDDEPAGRGFFAQYRNLLHHFVHQESGPTAETFWAGCGAIRREVFMESGGFCSSFARPSIEDVELGMRLRADGKRIHMERTLLVKHLKGWTMGGMLANDLRDRAIPWVRLLWRFRKVPNSLNTSYAHRAKLLVATLAPVMVFLAGFSPLALAVAIAGAGVFLYLSRGFLSFLHRKRGGRFMLAAVFWQWVFYVECGAAIAWVAFENLFGIQRLSRKVSS